jgi:hypothetical protein
MTEDEMTYAAPIAILKTNTRMSPKNVGANEFFQSGLVAYVMRSRYNGVVRMVTSWGHLGEGMEIGDMVTLVGDQTGRNIGVHEIMGIIDFTTMVKYIKPGYTWHAFKKSYPHYVVK